MKRWMWLAAGLCLVVGAGVALAEENKFGVEWDAEAVAAMSRSERLEYQKAYKAALEDAARQAGVTVGERQREASGRTAPQPELLPGTSITYHSGTLSPTSVPSSFMFGNQFDTALTTMGALGPVEMSGSITMVTFDMAAVSGNVFVSAYDQLAGASANQITSRSVPAAAGLNTLTFTGTEILNYVGSSFMAGVWVFGGDTLNQATGTAGGQGFHGMSINDGAVGMSFNAFTMTNAAFSVQGNVATPVELMNFEID